MPCLYVLIEIVASIVLGILFLFIFYLFTGVNKENFNTRMPNLLTEICTYADLAHPLL